MHPCMRLAAFEATVRGVIDVTALRDWTRHSAIRPDVDRVVFESAEPGAREFIRSAMGSTIQFPSPWNPGEAGWWRVAGVHNGASYIETAACGFVESFVEVVR